MEEIEALRQLILQALELCEDVDVLDLIYKLLTANM
jgi:hypothetical protein